MHHHPQVGHKQLNFIHAAERLAWRSPCRQQHGCVVVSRGKIIGSGHNFYKGVAFGRQTCHAEEAALRDVGCLKRCPKACIYIVRVKPGSLAYSAPCQRCMQAISRSGISRLVFSTHDGGYHIERGINN